MSYHKDIEEYTDKQIIDELSRRLKCNEKNICSYCKRNTNDNSCRYPEIHSGIKVKEFAFSIIT